MKYTQENVVLIISVIVISILLGGYLRFLWFGHESHVDVVCPACKYEGYNSGDMNDEFELANDEMQGDEFPRRCAKNVNIVATCAKCKKGDCPE